MRSSGFLLQWFRRPSVDLAEAIIRLRKLRNLTQSDLAQLTGTKQPAIARVESGHADPRLSTIVTIARALDATFRLDIAPREAMEAGFQMAQWWHKPELGRGVVTVHNQHMIVVSSPQLPSGGYHVFNYYTPRAGLETQAVQARTVPSSVGGFLQMVDAEAELTAP